jgi:hypothetical protein
MVVEKLVPASTAGRARVRTTRSRVTVTLYARASVVPKLSRTESVKSNVPSSMGKPESVVEGVPFETSVRPRGKLPCADQRKPAPDPPLAEIVVLYGAP